MNAISGIFKKHGIMLYTLRRTMSVMQTDKRGYSFEDIKIDVFEGVDEGIVVVGLERHSARNALSKKLTFSLLGALEAVQRDKNARVMILRSLIPGVFCAGADLKERATFTEAEVPVFVAKVRTLMNTIDNLPIPVIAALDGVALGGGLEMALACDIRTAAESARMGLVETKLAIIPGAGGTQRAARICGPAIAKELIFTSRVIDGFQAKELGIVNHVVKQNATSDAAYQKALEIAREIIPNGPIGVQMAKSAINKGLQVDINTGCFIEGLCYDQVVPTKDRVEGLTAFREKRKPIYKGE